MDDQADKVDSSESETPVTPESDGSDTAATPAPKRADVLRGFREGLANRHQHGGGKRQKPAGGNPRFK